MKSSCDVQLMNDVEKLIIEEKPTLEINEVKIFSCSGKYLNDLYKEKEYKNNGNFLCILSKKDIQISEIIEGGFLDGEIEEGFSIYKRVITSYPPDSDKVKRYNNSRIKL